MAEDTAFTELRGDLFGLAYRMLGSVTDAEDAVQDAFLRWNRHPRREVRNPRAYLTTLVTRLCIDALTSARAQRESYVGPWLPEPLIVDEADPSESVGMADSLSLAFLVLLEELSPPERAAFLLHDVFDFGYEEIAEILHRTQPACRQLVSRARSSVGDRRRRFDADRELAHNLTDRFVRACALGDVDGLVALLAEDATVWTDGGGKAKAAPRPVVGALRSARFLVGITKDVPPEAVARQLRLIGQPGLAITKGTEVLVVVTLDVLDGRSRGSGSWSTPTSWGRWPERSPPSTRRRRRSPGGEHHDPGARAGPSRRPRFDRPPRHGPGPRRPGPRRPGPRRPVLWAGLGVAEAVTGAWAEVAPASFYRSFPGGGWHWVAASGPYDAHLVHDFGGLSLALALVTFATALTRAVPPLLTAGAWVVFAVPHLAYHAAHLDQLPTGQDAANIAVLAAGVVVPLVATVLMWPWHTAPRGARP